MVRNPEVACDCIGKKRRDLKSHGRLLTNREMYIYFKDCIIAKSSKLSGVIERNRISLEFAEDLEESDCGGISGNVSRLHKGHWRTFEFRMNRKQFGKSDVYDSTQVIFEQISDSRLESKRRR